MTDVQLPFSPRTGIQHAAPWHGTPSDRVTLVGVIVRNFGDCECAPCPPYNPSHIHLCAGHAFYNECDEPGRTMEWTGIAIRDTEGDVTNSAHFSIQAHTTTVWRTDRLLFARSQRERWLKGEGIRFDQRRVGFDAWHDPELDGEKIKQNPEDFTW